MPIGKIQKVVIPFIALVSFRGNEPTVVGRVIPVIVNPVDLEFCFIFVRYCSYYEWLKVSPFGCNAYPSPAIISKSFVVGICASLLN